MITWRRAAGLGLVHSSDGSAEKNEMDATYSTYWRNGKIMYSSSWT